MLNQMFGWIIVVLCIYTILPTLIVRLFGFGAYKKTRVERSMALTFDDGPDPEYTPLLLDILQRYQVKATFFVLGSKAEKCPELIIRMHREGHLIGVHNYAHWTNAIMTPWRVRKQIKHSVDIIEQIIGEKPVYYRPPWGVINLFDFLLLKQFRLVLWSIIVSDWRSRGGKYKIKQKLLANLRDGAVIVLHDSGQTFGANQDAPFYMLEALGEFIEETVSKGYSFLRIDETLWLEGRVRHVQLSFFKRILVSIWLKWESLFHILFHLQPIDPENKLLYGRICIYHGKTLLLQDGEEIRKGDAVMELHFNNEMLFHMNSDSRSMVQLAVQMIHAVRQLLPKLVIRMTTDPLFTDIKGVFAITMIHRGTKQLGFSVLDIQKGVFFSLTRLYLRVLLFIMHPKGMQRLGVKTELLTPKILAISTKELKKRYLVGETIITEQNVPISPSYVTIGQL
jgi:peptidoglycan/xylan/chitin deacetylase (PgdA/CDA1 family)